MEISKEQKLDNEEGNLVSLLRLLIDCKDDHQAQRLKTGFYDSLAPVFFDRLKKSTSRLYGGIPDWEARMEEVFNDTFLTAFEEFKNFKIGDDWDNNECRKVLLNWLSKIANNKLLKFTRTTKNEKAELLKYKHFQLSENHSGEVAERGVYELTYDRAKFDKFWSNLNPMAKEIILICLENETLKEDVGHHISDHEVAIRKLKNDIDTCASPKKLSKHINNNGELNMRNTEHLPDETLEYLRLKYNVKSPAIRKAKQRALEGLRNCKI